jgi:hypothetical protein
MDLQLTGRRHCIADPGWVWATPYATHPAMMAPMPMKNWNVAMRRPRFEGWAKTFSNEPASGSLDCSLPTDF